MWTFKNALTICKDGSQGLYEGWPVLVELLPLLVLILLPPLLPTLVLLHSREVGLFLHVPLHIQVGHKLLLFRVGGGGRGGGLGGPQGEVTFTLCDKIKQE